MPAVRNATNRLLYEGKTILARSPALGRIGRFATMSDSLYPPIEQGAVILRSSRAKDAARAFLEFLTRPDIATALRAAGFGAPIAHPSR